MGMILNVRFSKDAFLTVRGVAQHEIKAQSDFLYMLTMRQGLPEELQTLKYKFESI